MRDKSWKFLTLWKKVATLQASVQVNMAVKIVEDSTIMERLVAVLRESRSVHVNGEHMVR